MSDEAKGAIVCGFAIGAIIVFVLSSVFFLNVIPPLNTKARSFRTEAVERGFAEWKVETDGSTTWKWKDEQRLEER